MNRLVAHVAALLLGSMYLMGCSQQRVESGLQEAADAQRPLIVVMGGNLSCKPEPGTDMDTVRLGPKGMQTYDALANLRSYLKEKSGVEARYIITCHNTNDTVYYYSDRNPDEMRRASVKLFAQFLQTYMQQTSTFIFAHSYGGWLAMRLTAELGPEQALRGLYTVDPISRQNCGLTTPMGCLEAPRDIDHDARLSIQKNAGQWQNYFQRQTSYLHSSEIPEAHLNIEDRVHDHFAIDMAPRIWASFQAHIAQFY